LQLKIGVWREFVKKPVADYLQLLKRRVVTAVDVAAKAEAQVDLALFELRTGKVDLANAMLGNVFSLGRSLDGLERLQVVAIAMFGEGVVHIHQGRFVEAVSQLLDTIEAARLARTPHICARALTYLARACTELAAYRDGLEYGLAGLDAGADTKDLRAIVLAHIAIAILHSKHQQPDLGVRYLQEVAGSAAELGDPFVMCIVKGCIAGAACNIAAAIAAGALIDASQENALKRALHDARGDAEDALAYSRTIDDLFSELAALGNLSEVAFMQENFAEAIAFVAQAYEIAVRLDSIHNASHLLLLWGGYNLKVGRVDEALGRLEEGLDYAKQSGYLEVEAKIQQKLAECYERQDRLLDALNAQKSYAKCIESQRVSELTNLVALTEAKRNFLSARSKGNRVAIEEDQDGD
jgi:tetratricopeptide (TPR) repeat protein